MKLKHLFFILLSCVLFTACGDDDNNDPGGPDTPSSKIVDQGVDANGIKWVLQENGTLTISGNGPMEDYPPGSTIQEVITPWTAYLANDIKKIVIENGVKGIGYNAFNHCFALETLEIGDSVRYINPRAFQFCEKLTNLIIPDKVEYIGNMAFQGCYSLIKLKLGKNLKILAPWTFDGCKSLEKIEFSNSKAIIERYAFRDCLLIKELTIPNSIIEIESSAFENCNALTRINSYCSASAYQYIDIFERESGNVTMYVPASKYAEYAALQASSKKLENIILSDEAAPAE